MSEMNALSVKQHKAELFDVTGRMQRSELLSINVFKNAKHLKPSAVIQ